MAAFLLHVFSLLFLPERDSGQAKVCGREKSGMLPRAKRADAQSLKIFV